MLYMKWDRDVAYKVYILTKFLDTILSKYNCEQQVYLYIPIRPLKNGPQVTSLILIKRDSNQSWDNDFVAYVS